MLLRNKVGLLPSPAVLWTASVRKRNQISKYLIGINVETTLDNDTYI